MDLFNILLKTFYWCNPLCGWVHFFFFSWNVKSMSSLGYKLSWPLAHLPKFLLCFYQEWSRMSYKGDCPAVYSFDLIFAKELRFEKCSYSSEVLLYFLSSLFGGVPIQYSQILVIFFPWFGSSLSFQLFLFSHLIQGLWHIFLCQIPFLHPSCIFILSLSWSPVLF